MEPRDQRAELRGAVYRNDIPALLAELNQEAWPQHALQLIGDGVRIALQARADGVEEAAERCVAALRERDWDGDAELATSIDAFFGSGATPLLQPLPVDLDELAGVLEGDVLNGGGRIDLRTGEVWPQVAIEYAEEVGQFDEDELEDDERWLWVECEGSHAAYADMEQFIEGIEDPDRADRMAIAIQGRGAFRRFKDVLSRWPELADQWYAFEEDSQRGRARAWLADEGYEAVPPPSSEG